MAEESEIYDTLTGIFRDVFLRDDIVLTPTLAAGDVEGWDSFKQIEIILAVETHYGISFRTKELDAMENVGDLVRLVAAKTA
ncbi:acyl carrier protein [Siccirubricoccus sp. KC 17139]|uniref:Acyl carrier protein n=1 Tax=Siccirubricoccus soli TaxID=2899147 RepID=A0ABT1D848_9PROT|nr:acyl carrier protein [Siccirubricoccus soli]MCO6417782.1 acyl carrier protein [Siccirubricoccus soli]MCP2683917.1 acyl carrier protein [Siccirubricoccus soli]